jgi:hypothetical protein
MRKSPGYIVWVWALVLIFFKVVQNWTCNRIREIVFKLLAPEFCVFLRNFLDFICLQDYSPSQKSNISWHLNC